MRSYAICLSLVPLSLLLLSGCQPQQPAIEVIAPIKAIKHLTITANDTPLQRRLSGYIKATDISELSFQVGGKLRPIELNVGDLVSQGQTLAQIEAKPYQIRLHQAQAELASAKAHLQERSDNYQRKKTIFERQLIDKNTFNLALANYQQAKNSVELVEAKLALAQRDLDNTGLTAPFDGVIARRDVESYEEVVTGQVIMEIQGQQRLEVSFLLPSNLIDGVNLGRVVKITIPTISEQQHDATITKLGAKADVRGAFGISAQIAQPLSSFKAGMLANIYITTTGSNAGVLVPEAVVMIAPGGGEQVFIFNPQTSTVHTQKVVTEFVDANTLRVISGLTNGDIVCSAGVELLRDGQQVSLYQAIK